MNLKTLSEINDDEWWVKWVKWRVDDENQRRISVNKMWCVECRISLFLSLKIQIKCNNLLYFVAELYSQIGWV